jgi:hypothetical protein
MDIPIYQDAQESLGESNGTTFSVPLSDMAGMNPSPPVREETPAASNDLLPPFLQLNSKIMYEHDGQYHKGFLGIRNGVYWFVYKSHVNKRKEDWGVNFPSLPQTWVDLCIEGILLSGHVAHSFLHDQSLPMSSTFNPVASFVSAVNLHWDYPPSLIKALAEPHPDCGVWLQSYYEEKQGIESLETYRKITLGK